MISQLEAAIIARLMGTDGYTSGQMFVDSDNLLQSPAQAQPVKVPKQHVPVNIMIPDEWVAGDANLPAVGIWRLSDEIEHEYYRIGQQNQPAMSPDGSTQIFTGVQQKFHQVPVKLTYEIAFRTREQRQFQQLKEQIERRLPKFGIGATFNVAYEVPIQTAGINLPGTIEIPWEQVAYADLSDQDRSGERDQFEARLTYAFRAWFDEFTWSQVYTILSVILTVNVQETLTQGE